MADGHPPQSNTLGKASLLLGVLSSVIVFMVGLCAGVAKNGGWLKPVAVVLFIIGATAAFMGFIGAFLGFGGLFGRNRSRASAVAGFLLGAGSVLLFLAIVKSAQ